MESMNDDDIQYDPPATEETTDNLLDPSATEETTDNLPEELQPDSNEELQSSPGKVKGESAAQNNRIGTQEPPIGGGSPIFRVPAHVRGVEKGAYTPKIVRVGPFYQNDQPNLRAFEKKKKRFLARLQTRMNCEVLLKNAMKEMEEKTRKWYVEDFEDVESDDFVRMMLLDGCFIVELLRLYTMKTSQVL
jgi:hypothetical protein